MTNTGVPQGVAYQRFTRTTTAGQNIMSSQKTEKHLKQNKIIVIAYHPRNTYLNKRISQHSMPNMLMT